MPIRATSLLVTLNFCLETFLLKLIPMPLLIFITVIIGLVMVVMVHFLYIAIMWLFNRQNEEIVTWEYFLGRIIASILSGLIGLLGFVLSQGLIQLLSLLSG